MTRCEGNAKYLPAEVVEPVGDFWEMIDGLVYGNQAGCRDRQGSDVLPRRTSNRRDLPGRVGMCRIRRRRVTGVSPSGHIAGNITFQRQGAPKAKQTPKEYVTDTLKRDDIVSGEDIKVGEYAGYIGKVDLDERRPENQPDRGRLQGRGRLSVQRRGRRRRRCRTVRSGLSCHCAVVEADAAGGPQGGEQPTHQSDRSQTRRHLCGPCGEVVDQKPR